MANLADIISGAGEVMGSAEAASRAREDFRQQQIMRQQMLESGVRRAELEAMATTEAKRNYADEQAVRSVQPTMRPATPGQNIYEPDNKNDVIATTPGIPETPDMGATYEARAKAWLARGRPDKYAEEMAKAKGLASEGIVDLARGLLSGDDPAAAAAKFSATGKTRVDPASVQWDATKGILTGKRDDGRPFVLDARRTLSDFGLLKSPNLVNLGPGHVAIDPVTGEQKAAAPAAPVPPRNIDPLSPAGLAAKKDFETWKSALTKKEGGDPAKIREIKALAELAFGGDIQQATEYAYGTKDTDRTSAVMRMAGIIKNDDALSQDPKKLLAKAEELVDGLRAKDAKTRGGRSPLATKKAPEPEQVGGPGAPNAPPADGASTPELPSTIEWSGQTLTWSGMTTPDGRRIYRNSKGQNFTPKAP